MATYAERKFLTRDTVGYAGLRPGNRCTEREKRQMRKKTLQRRRRWLRTHGMPFGAKLRYGMEHYGFTRAS